MNSDNLNNLVCEMYDDVADGEDLQSPEAIEQYLKQTVAVYSGNDGVKVKVVGPLEKIDGYYFLRSGECLCGFAMSNIDSIEFADDMPSINLK